MKPPPKHVKPNKMRAKRAMVRAALAPGNMGEEGVAAYFGMRVCDVHRYATFVDPCDPPPAGVIRLLRDFYARCAMDVPPWETARLDTVTHVYYALVSLKVVHPLEMPKTAERAAELVSLFCFDEDAVVHAVHDYEMLTKRYKLFTPPPGEEGAKPPSPPSNVVNLATYRAQSTACGSR